MCIKVDEQPKKKNITKNNKKKKNKHHVHIELVQNTLKLIEFKI